MERALPEKAERSKWEKVFLRHRIAFVAAGILLIVLLSLAAYSVLRKEPPSGLAGAPAPLPAPSPQPKPQLTEIVDTFKTKQTVTDALVRHGMSGQEVYDMVVSARPVYDLARVRAGQPYWLYLTAEGRFHDFRYPVDEEKYLTVYWDAEKGFVAVMKAFPYEIRAEVVAGVIDDSLFMSMLKAGEQEILALDLADIFGYDIDFYTDIQKGDSYRLLVEKKYLDGSFRHYGAILAASFSNEGRRYSGFRFEDELGKPAYYDASGKALKKSFLKSPLKFARITSRYSRARMHPVLKIVRPHLGVDYGAPAGTPVQAVGAGVVTAAGRNGASGRMVRLRHAGGYETMYLHLSRIGVRKGSRVAQGDVIGAVGTTGLATGPHLDFRVLFHGKPVNPTKVIFPPAPPVAPEAFAKFAGIRDNLNGRLWQ